MAAADAFLMIKEPPEDEVKLFTEILKPFVVLKMTAQPKNAIGEELFKDGTFLLALIRYLTLQMPATGNTTKINFYLFEHFRTTCKIEHSQYVFQAAAQRAYIEYY